MSGLAATLKRAQQSKFIRFALVGAAGFFVDGIILALGLNVLQLGPYAARGLSFLLAASFTWLANRRFTFAETAARTGRAAEWGRFLGANGLGGLINYGTYALIVGVAPRTAIMPYLGLAAGSVAGLSTNFLLSKHFVFRGHGAA